MIVIQHQSLNLSAAGARVAHWAAEDMLRVLLEDQSARLWVHVDQDSVPVPARRLLGWTDAPGVQRAVWESASRSAHLAADVTSSAYFSALGSDLAKYSRSSTPLRAKSVSGLVIAPLRLYGRPHVRAAAQRQELGY